MPEEVKKISIVIPAHNEGERILNTLEEYNGYFSGLPGDYELIVVANDCQDNTLEIVQKFSEGNPRVRYKDIPERGKGRAIIEGFKMAEGDVIAFTDADGAIKPWVLHDIIGHVGEHDVAIGSKYLRNSHAKVDYSLTRKVASRVWNLLVRIFLGLQVKDTQAGAKAFKREVVKDIVDKVRVLDYAFDVALLWEAKKQGYSIKEVPLEWIHLNGSKFSLFREAPKMFLDLVKMRAGLDGKSGGRRAVDMGKINLPIDEGLYRMIAKRAKERGFETVEDYVNFVLQEAVTQGEEAESRPEAEGDQSTLDLERVFGEEEEKEIEERLRGLGYL